MSCLEVFLLMPESMHYATQFVNRILLQQGPISQGTPVAINPFPMTPSFQAAPPTTPCLQAAPVTGTPVVTNQFQTTPVLQAAPPATPSFQVAPQSGLPFSFSAVFGDQIPSAATATTTPPIVTEDFISEGSPFELQSLANLDVPDAVSFMQMSVASGGNAIDVPDSGHAIDGPDHSGNAIVVPDSSPDGPPSPEAQNLRFRQRVEDMEPVASQASASEAAGGAMSDDSPSLWPSGPPNDEEDRQSYWNHILRVHSRLPGLPTLPTDLSEDEIALVESVDNLPAAQVTMKWWVSEMKDLFWRLDRVGNELAECRKHVVDLSHHLHAMCGL